MSFTIHSTPKTSYIRRPVRFGGEIYANRTMLGNKAQNAVWITTERLPAKVGGLGEVSKTIPEAIAEHLPEKDIRIIVPYQKKHREADQKDPAHAFKDTGVTLDLKTRGRKTAHVKVLQKFEYATGLENKDYNFTDVEKGGQRPIGNWVYALRADEYFIGKNEKGEEAGLSDFTYNPKSGEFDKVMLFNRAAAQLVPKLDGHEAKPAGSSLEQFNNPLKTRNVVDNEHVINQDPKNVDLVVAHDWLSGPVLNELQDKDDTKKIFMVHNKYDKIQAPEVSEGTGLLTPERLLNREENFSALQMGIDPADAAIVNRNFEHTLLNTDLGDGQRFVESLRKKWEEGRTFDMHHGLSVEVSAAGTKKDNNGKLIPPAFTQENNESWFKAQHEQLAEKQKDPEKNKKDIAKINKQLKEVTENLKALKEQGKEPTYQFAPLKLSEPDEIPTPEVMQAFKDANKKALQRKFGLEEDPNAVLIGWAARLEPRQKGFFMVQKAIEKALKDNPKVQFVVLGDSSDPVMQKWIADINEKYGNTPGKNRVYIPNLFANQDEVKQLNAASDFMVLPSIYEPYGLTQLEGMKGGAISIVHGVDGLRTTTNDARKVIESIFKGQLNGPRHEAVWDEPQNGILMAPVDIDKYSEYTGRRLEFESLETLKGKVEKPEGKDDQEKNKAKADSFEAFLDTLKSAASTRGHWRRLAEARIRKNTGGDNSRLEARVALMKAEAKEIQQLRERIKYQGSITPELFSQVQELMDPMRGKNKVEMQAISEQADNNLIEALERAVSLDRSQATQIRLNALKYVNKHHKWKTLVENKYKPVFENSTRDLAARARHQKEWQARHAESPEKAEETPEYTQTRPGYNTQSKGFSASVSYYWNKMWELNRKFWAAIGRAFSLRKD